MVPGFSSNSWAHTLKLCHGKRKWRSNGSTLTTTVSARKARTGAAHAENNPSRRPETSRCSWPYGQRRQQAERIEVTGMVRDQNKRSLRRQVVAADDRESVIEVQPGAHTAGSQREPHTADQHARPGEQPPQPPPSASGRRSVRQIVVPELLHQLCPRSPLLLCLFHAICTPGRRESSGRRAEVVAIPDVVEE